MALKCKSRILTAPKRGKASSLWPVHVKDGRHVDHPECGGDISIYLEIEGGGPCHCGDYCYCESPNLKAYVTCSKCINAFIDEDLQSGYSVSERVNKLIEFALEHGE